MNSKRLTYQMSQAAMIAALYTAVCLAFAPISFGPIQIRIAEAFTLLAVFSPTMVVGVTLGCAVSNLIGFMTGTNPLLMDVVIGTSATAIAAILSYLLRNVRLKKYPIGSVLPPIILNAIIIGAEITWLETGSLFAVPKVFAGFALSVGAGQLIPCLVLGPLLVFVLERTGVASRYLTPHAA